MNTHFRNILITLCTAFHITCSAADTKPYVIGEIMGQLGNNLFQVATTCAVAWDNNADPYFPTLLTKPVLCQHVFSRFKFVPPSDVITLDYREPTFEYAPVPFFPGMMLTGYFQSEKYFLHHRERLLKLLAPTDKDLKYIKKNYKSIIEHPKTVGIQIRLFFEDLYGEVNPLYGKDYFQKAMALFPDDSLFVVSTNNMEFARKVVPTEGRNVVFLGPEEYYIEFYILTMCKNIIISNSTFGWWAAWLNNNPDKIVVRPAQWLTANIFKDVCPESWIVIDAKKGTPEKREELW